MNIVALSGRLTRDVETKQGKGKEAKSYARFTLAVGRPGKDAVADYVSCVAFGQTADFLGNYGEKGTLIGVEGSISTGSYEKDGATVYTTDVLVNRVNIYKWPAKEEEQEAPKSNKKSYRR